jgi:diadenosine tetraphosphate (Ap4A) HIT family hydrolase
MTIIAQGACAFCSKESLKTLTLLKNDTFAAVINMNPAVFGHILLVPSVNHIARFVDLSIRELKDMTSIIKEVADIFVEKLKPHDVGLVFSQNISISDKTQHWVAHMYPIKNGEQIKHDQLINDDLIQALDILKLQSLFTNS